MLTNQLVEFVRNELKRGISHEDIKRLLLQQTSAGWQDADIEEAFRHIEQTDSPPKQAASGGEPVFVAEKSAKKKSTLAAIVLIFGILFLGSSVFAYWYFIRDNSSSDNILYDSLNNWLKVQTFTYSGDFSISARLSGGELILSQAASPLSPLLSQMLETQNGHALPEQLSTLLTFRGVVDRSDEQNPKFDFNGNVKIAIPGYGNLSTDIEMRAVDQKLYFKISNLPYLGIETGAFANKWIEVVPEDLAQIIEQYDPDQAVRLREQLNRYTEPDHGHLSAASGQKIIALAREMDMLTVINQPSREEIGGRPSWHYNLGVNWQNIWQFYSKVLEIVSHESGVELFSQNQINQLDELLARQGQEGEATRAKISDFLAQNLQIEFWIDKKSILPRQQFVRLTVDNQDMAELFGISPHDTGVERITVSVRITYDNFDESVSVEIPAESTNISELLIQPLETAKSKARDALRISNMSQLRLANEFYYDDNSRYAPKLEQLTSRYIAELPDNEPEGTIYHYSIRPDAKSYHLGVSVESDSSLQQDDDFSSITRGWVGGFSGSDSSPCKLGDVGKYCYDKISP
jgi:hypothetical protein